MQTTLVAEIGNAHDGSLGNAHAYIDAVAEAGAQAVKFQCRIAEQESTEAEQFRPGTHFPQDKTRFAYWQRVQFSRQQWAELAEHAQDRQLLFGASVFCSLAVAWLDGLVDFWKVPAPAWSNGYMLGALSHTTGPIYWSLGHHPAIPGGLLPEFHARITPLVCVSRYPSRPEELDLSSVNQRVGLSDHSGQKWPAVIAAYRGAPVVEVHVCWHRGQFGPDTPASLTVDQLAEVAQGIQWCNRLGRSPITTEAMAEDHHQFMKGRRVA